MPPGTFFRSEMRDFKSRYHFALTGDVCMGVIGPPCVSYTKMEYQSYLPSDTAVFPSLASPIRSSRAAAVPHVSGIAFRHMPEALPS